MEQVEKRSGITSVTVNGYRLAVGGRVVRMSDRETGIIQHFELYTARKEMYPSGALVGMMVKLDSGGQALGDPAHWRPGSWLAGQKPSWQPWEYRTEVITTDCLYRVYRGDQIEDQVEWHRLDELGLWGWELCFVLRDLDGALIGFFKRPKDL